MTMNNEKDVDLAVEKILTEEQRALLLFTKLIISQLPDNVKSEMAKEFSKTELEAFSDCKINRHRGPSKKQLMRFAKDELKYLLEDGGWITVRIGRAVVEFVLSITTLLSYRRREKIIGLLNKDGLLTYINGLCQTTVPASYIIFRISEYAFLSPENSKLVWEAMITLLTEGKTDLLFADIGIKHPSPDAIEIQRIF